MSNPTVTLDLKDQWTKKVTMSLVNGVWTPEFESRSGQLIVTALDIAKITRALKVGQRTLQRRQILEANKGRVS